MIQATYASHIMMLISASSGRSSGTPINAAQLSLMLQQEPEQET
jgi:hypothetical protein